MSTLHVRSVPDDLYQKLQQLARSHNRSLSAQVIAMLAQAVEERQGEVLASIHQRRSAPTEKPHSQKMLREDRDR